MSLERTYLSFELKSLSLEENSGGFKVKICIFCLIFTKNCRIFEFSFEICLSLAKNLSLEKTLSLAKIGEKSFPDFNYLHGNSKQPLTHSSPNNAVVTECAPAFTRDSTDSPHVSVPRVTPDGSAKGSQKWTSTRRPWELGSSHSAT